MGSQADNQLKAFLNLWRDKSVDFIEAHTSGSTGAPKRILLPRADMEASARATCRAFGIDADSRLHCPLSMEYIAGKMMAVRAEVAGAMITVEEPSSHPLSSLKPSDRPIDLLPIVPAQIDGLLDSIRSNKWLVRNVIVGGAPCTHAQIEALQKASFDAYATYGMTETCSHVALRCITLGDDYYTALPGITFETDLRGCLRIVSPNFSWQTLQTNDVVELLSPIRFRWLGRADNVIISGGLKIHPEELEQRIANLLPPGLVFFVGSAPSAKWGRVVTLEIESSESLDTEKITNILRTHLAPHELPRQINIHRSLRRTASGKLIRQTV